jgi:L-rhamnose-H+ transport protein
MTKDRRARLVRSCDGLSAPQVHRTAKERVSVNTVFGVLIAMLGGFMAGNCMVPLKYLRRWRWENAWIVFSLVALIVVPWTLAFFRVPDLMGVYAGVNIGAFIMPFLYGAGWGVAQVLFGLAVLRIGMALSFATTIGLGAALGVMVPILLRHPAVLKTPHGEVLLMGVFLMVAGVIVCSWAGHRREREQQAETPDVGKGTFASGLIMATAAGLLSPMLNYSLAFGDRFVIEALRHHATAADAPYAVWPIALVGGAVPNLAYSIWLVFRNQTWGNFFPIWPQILLGTIMGVLWMGSVAAYGTATTLLGLLGASIGWSIYQISIILTSNISGWIAGEWKGAGMQSKVALWSGLFLLGSATLVITYSNH